MNRRENSPTPPVESNVTVEIVCAWVLRVGVILSVVVMLTGIAFTFVHHPPSPERMAHDPFNYHPAQIWAGVRHGSGKSIIEVGIYLLVLTPITRVFMSALIFLLVERDWLYAVITFVVLLLTLAGLLLLK